MCLPPATPQLPLNVSENVRQMGEICDCICVTVCVYICRGGKKCSFSRMFTCNRDNFNSISSLSTHHSHTVHPKLNEVTGRPIRYMLWSCGPPGLQRWMDRLQSLSRRVEGEEDDSACKADVKRKLKCDKK